MSTNKNESKKSTEIMPRSSTSDLFSLNEVDDFFSGHWPRLWDWNFPVALARNYPKVDVLDYDNEIEVQAELPGVNKDDLEISISNQFITIRVSKHEEKKEEGRYYRREITRGEFQRTVSLPDNIDDEHASASFKDGILTVSIPKTKKSKRKTIDIQ